MVYGSEPNPIIDEPSIADAALRAPEIDLEYPWRYTDAEITDLAARVQWGHVENEEAIQLLKSLCVLSHVRPKLRAKYLVSALENSPTELFWPVFLNAWPGCLSWRFRKRFIRMLRHHAEQEPAVNYMHPAAAEFFNSLPQTMIAFRGCAAECSRGLSWSTDQNVAKQFAVEHFGRSSNQVLATAKIHKKHIFAVCVEEGLSEIIVDPMYMQDVHLSAMPTARGLRTRLGDPRLQGRYPQDWFDS